MIAALPTEMMAIATDTQMAAVTIMEQMVVKAIFYADDSDDDDSYSSSSSDSDITLAEIIVTYHAKKEFAIPYAPRNVSKRNYEELAQEFLDIGFTEVYTRPLRDLKVGWLVKENTVGKVTIGSNQNFTKVGRESPRF